MIGPSTTSAKSFSISRSRTWGRGRYECLLESKQQRSCYNHRQACMVMVKNDSHDYYFEHFLMRPIPPDDDLARLLVRVTVGCRWHGRIHGRGTNVGDLTLLSLEDPRLCCLKPAFTLTLYARRVTFLPRATTGKRSNSVFC